MEDNKYEKIKFSNKIFMYSSPEWIHEYPVVDIIKNLKSNSLINYLYGKGSVPIKKYVKQYNHRLIGCELKNKDDYISVFKKGKVDIIFIFSDSKNEIIKNLINCSKNNDILLVEYSTNDYNYHFNEKVTKDPVELLTEIYFAINIKPFTESFVEFDIIPSVEVNINTNLKKCIEVIKKRDQEEQNMKEYRKIKYFDPHLKILNDHKKEIEKKNIKIEDDNISNNTNTTVQKKDFIQRFFIKK